MKDKFVNYVETSESDFYSMHGPTFASLRIGSGIRMDLAYLR